MKPLKVTLLGVLLVLAQACRQPISIHGDGDVWSDSGTRDCTLEDFQLGLPNCSENEVTGSDYVESYTAQPRAGYQFRRWGNYCKRSRDNHCSFNVPASVVEKNQGKILPPLQAVFRPTVNTGFVSLLMGDGFFSPAAQGLAAHALDHGFPDHQTTAFLDTEGAGSPGAFFSNTTLRDAIQARLDGGEVELVGMTYSPLDPDILGYQRWISRALAQNPDTRFFIATPAPADPGTLGAALFDEEYDILHEAVHDLVDSLRMKYPGVDIYCVPHGQAAVELFHLWEAGNLPDVSTLVGPASSSVFADAQPAPGDILVALGELLWFGAIYDIDLSAYPYFSGYTTDVKLLAQSILDDHHPAYQAPDEVDVDTDGDGIVDRHDPNPSGRHNLLLIMADDLGFNDLAINNGNTQIDTPNMDQLAQEGVRFTRHYASPVCSPARAALLSGMYPERVGYSPNGRGLSPELETLPRTLQREGYRTWHIGKWHIGDLDRAAWPDMQGFDRWFGFLNQWRLAGEQTNGEIQLARPRYEDPWLEGDEDPGQHYFGHLENILTDKALEVLSDLHHRREPWFLNLWFYAPHGPVSPAPEFAQNYPDTDAGRYRALVNQLDFNVGRLMSHLNSLGVGQDTIVVVVSDNGGNSVNVDSNAPYAGVKATISEGGLRTPLLIRWPDVHINGQVVDRTISIQDLFPTLMEALGVPVPAGLDGVSHYPSIQQLASSPERDLFWELTVQSHGVLSQDGNWRLLLPLSGTSSLLVYDLLADFTASFPVIPTPIEKRDELSALYETWYRDAHEVSTLFAPDGTGGGTLTGMGFLRTPGLGPYTFGIGIPATLQGQIAAQSAIWSIERSGNTVTANYGNLVLSGDITLAGSCHSIAISGTFYRIYSTLQTEESIDLTLYIDGVAVDSGVAMGALDIEDLTAATVIGDSLLQSDEIGVPVIVNQALDSNTPWTIEDFSVELCPADS